jgi:cellulose synthase/poly-beta-1,6-N-acetylglucosamine synthase-like glycosyltransferase
MLSVLQVLLSGVVLLLLVPVAVLFVEVLLATTGAGSETAAQGSRRPLAILIPAHNECNMIAATLRSIKPQLENSDRIVVVADNCTDDTAILAQQEGAEAIPRFDLARRGKGFALDFGIRHLEQNPPEFVIVVDADCQVTPGTIDLLAKVCDSLARPVQAMYVMHARPGGGVGMQIAEFAWTVRNLVRPSGLHRLGLPCHLMGSGMAFPWSRIRSASLATGHIVEDLKLGIDLARAGAPPIYCAAARVTSEFPLSTAGVVGQRTRWEHGHLNVILAEAPRLFMDSFRRLNAGLLALALDLIVPPLALLTMLVGSTWVAACILYVATKARLPIAVSSVTLALLAFSIFFAWHRHGRHIISLGKLAFVGLYAILKLPIYAKFLVTRQTAWIRSKREEED